MLCANLLIAPLAVDLPDPHSFQSVGWVIIVLGVLGGLYLLLLRIGNERAKKIRTESGAPEERRLLPNPLVTKKADEFVTTEAFSRQTTLRDQQLKDMESRIEKRIDEHEKLVRQRFHDIKDDLDGIQKQGELRGEELSEKIDSVAGEAKEGRELATRQFQKIEGRLGELRATSEQTNALAIRTDQRVANLAETLPDKIANAVARNGRRH